MARINREAITTLIVDARGASTGAAEFDRASARIKSAASASQRIIERTNVIIGEQGKAYTRLMRQIDPTFTAQEKFAKGVKTLDGIFKGATGLPEYQRALKLLEAKYKDTGDAAAQAAKQQAEAMAALQMRAQTLTEKMNPLARAQRLHNEALKEARELMAGQVISAKTYEQAIDHAAAALKRAQDIAAGIDPDGASKTPRDMTARRLTQLSPQISDIVTQMASGTSPLTILVQQGPQIADIFGGIPTLLAKIPPSVYAIGASFLVLGTAAALTASRMAEIAAQARTIESIGRTFNPQVAGMARELRGLTMAMTTEGVSRADAMKAVEQLARTKTLQAELYASIARVTPDVALALGTDAPGAAKELAEAFSTGANGVRDLDERLKFLSPTMLRQIEQMDRAGDRIGAMRLAMQELTRTYEGEALLQLSAWERMTTAMGNAWDALWEKIATSPQALAFMRDVSNVADMITRALGGASAATPAAPGATTAQASGSIEDKTAEIKRLTAEINAATKQATELQTIMDAGIQPVLQDEIDEAWTKAGELEIKRQKVINDLAELENAGKAKRPEAGAAAASVEQQGLSDAAIKRINAARDAFKYETDAMAGNALQRSITLAGLEAFNASLARNETAQEARQYQMLAMEKVERDIAIAIRDTNELLDLNIDKTRESADAYADSVQAGLKADAARQAAVDALQTGADPVARARRILNQNAEDARAAANKNFVNLQADNDNAAGIADGAYRGPRGLESARRMAEAEVAYRQQISAAEAAGNTAMVAGLREQQIRYEGLLAIRDEYDRQTREGIALFEQNRANIIDAVSIMQDGFADLVVNGEKFNDVLKNMSKAFLQLGTDVLVMQPMNRWLNATMEGSSGSDIWSILSTVGSAVVGAVAGAAGGPSAMPNAANDAGAMTAQALLADWKTTVPVAHRGWHVGAEKPQETRTVPSSVFVNAPRFHNGLAPNEFAAILQRGEEVLTARNPRHRANYRAAGNVIMNINTPNADSFRQSQTQMAAAASRAMSIAGRRNG